MDPDCVRYILVLGEISVNVCRPVEIKVTGTLKSSNLQYPQERQTGGFMADSNSDDQQSGRRRVKCPDCGGSGQVVLLTTRHPCQRCAGSGTIAAGGALPARRTILTIELCAEPEPSGWCISWGDGQTENPDGSGSC
jgi:hypothetical protein